MDHSRYVVALSWQDASAPSQEYIDALLSSKSANEQVATE